MPFYFDQIPDCVIVEVIDALVPAAWYRLSDAVPFVGDWTWHERTMLHLRHKDAMCRQQREAGNDTWYQNGHIHRHCDLPAMTASWGDEFWLKNGQIHRDGDLPALVWIDGNMEWYRHGQRHRDNDRPAVEYWFGGKEWWKDDVKYREPDYNV